LKPCDCLNKNSVPATLLHIVSTCMSLPVQIFSGIIALYFKNHIYRQRHGEGCIWGSQVASVCLQVYFAQTRDTYHALRNLSLPLTPCLLLCLSDLWGGGIYFLFLYTCRFSSSHISVYSSSGMPSTKKVILKTRREFHYQENHSERRYT